MPTTIPYDPSLVLGNIIDPGRIEILKQIADEQKTIDAAQDNLNNLLLYKYSLDMTMQEMLSMEMYNQEPAKGGGSNGAGGKGGKGQAKPDLLSPLKTEIDQLKADIIKAAVDYGKAAISGQKKIAAIKKKTGQTQIHDEIESPIDYNKSAIKKMPISSDSLKMDAQYFRFEKNQQSEEDHANSVAAYVSYSASSIFGSKAGAQIGGSVKTATQSQLENHNIQGTLVITANCTHKQADVFAPFVLDVDKAIAAWNAVTKDPIDMENEENVKKIFSEKENEKSPRLSILSGATYGSSFVGMVHILQEEDTASSQNIIALASSLRAEMEVGNWFAKESGKFGVDSSFANSVKNLLSTSTLQSHCSVVTMGLIPSLKANTISTVVKEFKGDNQARMGELAAIQGATNTDLTTVATSASGAKEGQSLAALNSDYLKAAIAAVGDKDKVDNMVLDTNSLMTAFEDFIQKAIAGESGVPINFFIKPISKKQLAKAWINKYYPNQGYGVEAKETE